MKSKVLASLVLFTLVFTTKLFANEKDVYEFSWLDPDKEVFVLQNRKFRKVDHAYINVGGGITTSGAFVDATSIQGRVGYFFSEDWGLEGIYTKNSGKENSTATSVRGQNLGGSGTTPFRRIVEGYTGAMIIWSPFYSKINTFNKIVYMDWIFGFGYAQLKEKNNKLRFIDGPISEGIETKETHSGFMWELGLKFYINESFSIRTDLTAVNYKADNIATSGSSLKQNYDATVSLGYTF